jgi:hypothetical protein
MEKQENSKHIFITIWYDYGQDQELSYEKSKRREAMDTALQMAKVA